MEKIITEFAATKTKTYSYLADGNDGNKKTKGTNKCPIKRKPKFGDYNNFLEATRLKNKINQLEKFNSM